MVNWKILETELETGKKVREFLNSCVDHKKLSSLDEAVGTIVTLTAASFALFALLFLELQQFFGFATIVTTLFFWVSYRIAKILHAIEIRFLIIASFFTFIFWIGYFSILHLLLSVEGIIQTILMLVFSAAGIVLISLACVKASNRIWRWLTNDSLIGWSPMSFKVFRTKDETKREDGFLIFYMVLVYGMYSFVVLIGGVNLLIITGPMCLILLFGNRQRWSKTYEIWLKSISSYKS